MPPEQMRGRTDSPGPTSERGCLLNRSVPTGGTVCRFPGPLLVLAEGLQIPERRSIFAGSSVLAGSPGAIPPTSF